MLQHEALAGKTRLGSGVVAGYFTQDASDLDPELSPIEILTMEDGMSPPEARTLLGRFLLTGDDVYRPIRTLSGGEKNKLSLARLTNLNPNLLVLDEPTNHLDMASREALASVLKDYAGTLILISHDRWLLSEVTNNTLDIRRNQTIQFGGSYLEYRAFSAKKSNPQPESINQLTQDDKPKLSPREVSKGIERLKKEITEAESLVESRERELANLELKLSNIQPGDDVHALSIRHHEMQTEVAESIAQWESRCLELEELEAMQKTN
jgi:ATP-binding cassette subfamily F protein 3